MPLNLTAYDTQVKNILDYKMLLAGWCKSKDVWVEKFFIFKYITMNKSTLPTAPITKYITRTTDEINEIIKNENIKDYSQKLLRMQSLSYPYAVTTAGSNGVFVDSVDFPIVEYYTELTKNNIGGGENETDKYKLDFRKKAIQHTKDDTWLNAVLNTINQKSGSKNTSIYISFIENNAESLKGINIQPAEFDQLLEAAVTQAGSVKSTTIIKDRVNAILKKREVDAATKEKTKTIGDAKPKVVKIKPVYPDTFFNHEHPTAPNVIVQFRTSYSSEQTSLTDENNWVDIATYKAGFTDDKHNVSDNNQNKFFYSMELEDTAGIKKLTLVLKDKFYTDLENIIMTSLFSTVFTNKMTKETRSKPPSSLPDFEQKLYTFVTNPTSFVNLRISFGYNISKSMNPEDFVSMNDYLLRTEEKGNLPVLQSPWIYFQIMNAKQSFGEDGLTFTLSALSTSSTFFSKAKMVRRFANIVGKPENIIENFRKGIESVSIGGEGGPKVTVAPFGDTLGKEGCSDKPQQTTPIEIQSGPELKIDKDGKEIEEYRSIADFLSEICRQVKPIKKTISGEIKTTVEDSNEAEEDGSIIRYSYFVDEDVVTGNVKITFRYENPDSFWERSNVKLRTYFWKEYPKTVVKSMSIASETDFASMNMPIFETTFNGGKASVIVANEGKSPAEFEGSSIYTMRAKGSVDTPVKKDFNFSFVSNGGARQEKNNEQANDFYSSVQSRFKYNINNNIFKGSIELDGDPFYLFDKKVEPYKYIIKVIINRTSEGNTVKYIQGKEESNVSYLSGYYVVNNIKHTIGEGGFSTTLDVMRWPSNFVVEDLYIIDAEKNKRMRAKLE